MWNSRNHTNCVKSVRRDNIQNKRSYHTGLLSAEYGVTIDVHYFSSINLIIFDLSTQNAPADGTLSKLLINYKFTISTFYFDFLIWISCNSVGYK